MLVQNTNCNFFLNQNWEEVSYPLMIENFLQPETTQQIIENPHLQDKVIAYLEKFTTLEALDGKFSAKLMSLIIRTHLCAKLYFWIANKNNKLLFIHTPFEAICEKGTRDHFNETRPENYAVYKLKKIDLMRKGIQIACFSKNFDALRFFFQTDFFPRYQLAQEILFFAFKQFHFLPGIFRNRLEDISEVKKVFIENSKIFLPESKDREKDNLTSILTDQNSKASLLEYFTEKSRIPLIWYRTELQNSLSDVCKYEKDNQIMEYFLNRVRGHLIESDYLRAIEVCISIGNFIFAKTLIESLKSLIGEREIGGETILYSIFCDSNSLNTENLGIIFNFLKYLVEEQKVLFLYPGFIDEDENNILHCALNNEPIACELVKYLWEKELIPSYLIDNPNITGQSPIDLAEDRQKTEPEYKRFVSLFKKMKEKNALRS